MAGSDPSVQERQEKKKKAAATLDPSEATSYMYQM